MSGRSRVDLEREFTQTAIVGGASAPDPIRRQKISRFDTSAWRSMHPICTRIWTGPTIYFL